MLILIADDEAPARRELSFMLAELWPEADLLETSDGLQALEQISSQPVDIAFLDINMPEMDGLEVAAALLEMPDAPAVVFATAYDEHALRAFELAAVDYIVKPFDERRLAQTVARLKQQAADQAVPSFDAAALQALLKEIAPPAPFTKLWGERENETRRLLDYADVLWLEARDRQVYLGANGEEYVTQYTLKELEARLPSPPFVRVHRGFIVNLEHVREVVPWFSGGYLLRMDDAAQTEIPMSRRYAVRVKELTGW